MSQISAFRQRAEDLGLDLVDRGLIRIIDLTFIAKAEDGSVALLEIADLGQEVEAFAEFAGASSGLLSEDDIGHAAEALEPGTSAALLVFENSWAAPFATAPATAWVAPDARIEEGATIEGPCFIDEGVVVKTGARVGPYSVIGRQCHVEEHATVEHSIVWANSRISQEAIVRRSILARHCHIGRSALVEDGVVLGDKSVVTDYSRL